MAKESSERSPSGIKYLCGFFVCLLAAGTVFSQSVRDPAPASIEILKLKWERQVRLPRNFDPAIIPTNGTFADPARNTAPVSPTDAVRAATAARSAAASSTSAFPDVPRRLPVFYAYSMKVKNTGPKTVEGIAWDYLFLDANDNRELGKHQFLNYEKITTDKTAILRTQLRSPPVRVVPASSTGSKPQSKFTEKGLIQCVLYSDDTVWRSANAPEGLCDLLKSGKAAARRKHPAA